MLEFNQLIWVGLNCGKSCTINVPISKLIHSINQVRLRFDVCPSLQKNIHPVMYRNPHPLTIAWLAFLLTTLMFLLAHHTINLLFHVPHSEFTGPFLPIFIKSLPFLDRSVLYSKSSKSLALHWCIATFWRKQQV